MKIGHLKIQEEFEKDVDHISKIFESYGIIIPNPDILLAWGLYSETKNEEWSAIPEKDEDVYLAIVDYFDIEKW